MLRIKIGLVVGKVVSEDTGTKVVEIDRSKMVPMSNKMIEDRLLDSYSTSAIKIVMIGVVGAYAVQRQNYDHRCFIKFSVANFAKLLGQTEKYAITVFKQACAELRTKEIPISGYLDGEPMVFVSGILNTFAYSKNEKTLALKFEEHFVPHFMEMSGNFTQHELSYILNLSRVHTISFYRFLKMKIGKEYINIVPGKEYFLEIDGQLLRRFFECENKYTAPRDFRNKVLNKIAEEITAGTDLIVAFGQEANSKNHIISFVKKPADQEPKIVNMDDFKFTKDRSLKKPEAKKKLGNKNRNLPPIEGEAVVVSDNTQPENRDAKPMQIGALMMKAHAHERGVAQPREEHLTNEQLDELSVSFLSSNQALSLILKDYFDKELCTQFLSQKELFVRIFSLYNQRHGSIKLKSVVTDKIHVFEKYFSDAVENKTCFSLVSFKTILELLEK